MSKKLKILRAHDRVRVITPVGKESRTHQSFKDECDINRIMSRYMKTGVIDHMRSGELQYGDVSSSIDYHHAMNVIIAANDVFEALPAQVRKRFDNDPAQMLAFVEDPENLSEARELGLVSPEASQPIEAAPEPPEASPEPPEASPAPGGASSDQNST